MLKLSHNLRAEKNLEYGKLGKLLLTPKLKMGKIRVKVAPIKIWGWVLNWG
jgi:hypothetical protein